MTIKNRKLLKKAILISTTTSLMSIPILITVGNSLISQTNNSIAMRDAIEYIKKNSIELTNKEEIVTEWKIVYNGETKSFNSPDELTKFVEHEFIEAKSYISNLNLDDFLVPGLNNLNEEKLNNASSKLYNNKDDEFKKAQKVVYRGLDDKAYVSESDAKNSFINYNEAYYFNGVYFKTKSDLKSYLINVYFKENNTKYNSIVIKGPNGITSSPINIANSNKAIQEINSFIKNNAFKTIKYKNSKNGETFLINKNNIEQNINNINIKDLSHIHIQSNQGESRYVIDNKDSSNLIGPYFYKGNLDIGSFKNKKMWRKTQNINKFTYVESKIDALIGSFFTSIINDDVVTSIKEAEDSIRVNGVKKDVKLFRTLLTLPVDSSNPNAEPISLDDWFMSELGRLSPELKNELIHNQLELMQGNKYNTFYKIPLFYNFLLQRIVTWGLGQEVLDLVVYYFTEVTKFIQDVLEVVLINDELLYKNEGNKKIKFNATEFFQIGNPEYDINTSVEYFMSEIKKYKGIIGGIWSYIGALNNTYLLAGIAPFNSNDPTDLIEFGVMTNAEFSTMNTKFKGIYEVFSASNYQGMIKKYISCSNNPKIMALNKLPEAEQINAFNKLITNNGKHQYEVILRSIGLSNNEYIDMVRAALLAETRVFIQSGSIFKNGYLIKLYNPNKSKSRIPEFVKYVSKYPNEDIYRVYIAFVMDIKLNKHIFKNPEFTSNPTNFALAIAQLVSLGLVGAGIASTTINSMYNTKPSKNNWDGPIQPLHENQLVVHLSTQGESYARTSNIQQRNRSDDFFDYLWRPEWNTLKPTRIESTSFVTADWEFDTISSSSSSSIKGVYNPNYIFHNPSFDENSIAFSKKSGIFSEKIKSPVEDVQLINFKTINGDPINGDGVKLGNIFQDSISIGNRNFGVEFDFDLDATDHSKVLKSKKINDWGGRLKTGLGKVGNVINDILLPVAGTAFMVLEMVMLFIDLFKKEYIPTYYVYTTADGTEFIWDGGLSVVEYLGFKVTELSNIDSMELIDPIQITLPQLEEYYYFNAIKSYDIKSSIRTQFKYFLDNNNVFNNKNMIVEYSLVDATATDLYSSIDDLINGVLKGLNITQIPNTNEYDFSNINKSSIYFSNATYNYSIGLVATDSSRISALAENVIDNIRLSQIIQLPNLDDKSHAISNSEFILPEKYYDPYVNNGTIISNTTKNTYIVDHSANKLKENIQLPTDQMYQSHHYEIEDKIVAQKESKKILLNLYNSKVSVASTNATNMDLINSIKYSQIVNTSDYKTVVIFGTKNLGISNDLKFANKTDAIRYINSKLKLEQKVNTLYSKYYLYNKHLFKSDKEINEFLNDWYVKYGTYSLI